MEGAWSNFKTSSERVSWILAKAEVREEIRLDRDKDGLEDFGSDTTALDTGLDALSDCERAGEQTKSLEGDRGRLTLGNMAVHAVDDDCNSWRRHWICSEG